MSAATIVGLWRYPVKSMGGETCTSSRVGARGLAGDRAYALVDAQTGKVASAKNPRLWGDLLSYAARYVDQPGTNGSAACVEVALPDGTRLRTDDNALATRLSTLLGREVRLSASAPEQPVLEEYWPDLDDLAHRDVVTDEAMPTQTFFDCARVHVLSTNTLAALRAAAPQSVFEPDRFRPNVLVELPGGPAFAEDSWIGAHVRLGDDVVLRISGPAPRCVMTTLARPGYAADLGVLRTAARQHGANVGVYADVIAGGDVKLGDSLTLVS